MIAGLAWPNTFARKEEPKVTKTGSDVYFPGQFHFSVEGDRIVARSMELTSSGDVVTHTRYVPHLAIAQCRRAIDPYVPSDHDDIEIQTSEKSFLQSGCSAAKTNNRRCKGKRKLIDEEVDEVPCDKNDRVFRAPCKLTLLDQLRARANKRHTRSSLPFDNESIVTANKAAGTPSTWHMYDAVSPMEYRNGYTAIYQLLAIMETCSSNSTEPLVLWANNDYVTIFPNVYYAL